MDFPITLDDGKSADYGWPLQDFAQRQTPEFRDEFGGVCGAVKVRLSRLCVSTSTGDEFQTRPEKELRALIRKIAMEKK